LSWEKDYSKNAEQANCAENEHLRTGTPHHKRTVLCFLYQHEGLSCSMQRIPEMVVFRIRSAGTPVGGKGFGFDGERKIGTVGYNESDTSMIPRQIGGELAVFVALCIVAIFFFPAMQGPYSAVNGPATAFQAARATARLRIRMVQAAVNSFANFPLLLRVNSLAAGYTELHSASFADCSTILRC
jgi:hypothetical protein